MTITLLTEDKEDGKDDLPWYKDYAKNGGVTDKSHIVLRVIGTERGLLLLMDKFKAFAFGGSKLEAALQEALDGWVKEDAEFYPLVAVETKAGRTYKLTFGIDDGRQPTIWVLSEQDHYVSGFKNKRLKKVAEENPFISRALVPRTPPKSDQSTKPPDSNSTPNEATAKTRTSKKTFDD